MVFETTTLLSRKNHDKCITACKQAKRSLRGCARYHYKYMVVVLSDTFGRAIVFTVYEDFASLPTKNEAEKKRIIFDLIKQGLLDYGKN